MLNLWSLPEKVIFSPVPSFAMLMPTAPTASTKALRESGPGFGFKG